ncbi:hypothetical protein AB0G35_25750 [Streptomyces sp. NPDC021749]|uniref:hypothetical protein n=1 Tax=Streptomyces sp. NPDC021749 TaxID=3154905 RepID=UPI0033D9FE60
MRRTPLLAAPALLLALAGCVSRSAAVTAAPPHPAPTTTSPSPREQDRSLPCGSTVERPVAVSGPDDPLHLTVTSLRRQGSGLRTAYRITSGDRKEMLSLPIGEVPPTARLLKHGVIVGRQKPAADQGPDGRPATGYPVGRRPYQGTLAIDALCPGTTWSDVDRHPGDYRVVVVMSDQPHGAPSDSRPADGVHLLPLQEATRDVSTKDR